MNSHFQKVNKHQRVPQIHYSPEMYVEITMKYHFTYISLTEWEGCGVIGTLMHGCGSID